MFDRIGNTLREGDLVEFPLPQEYHIVIATIEGLEEGGVITQGNMKLPPRVRLRIDISCNLTDFTNQGIFRQLVVVKNPKKNEPANNAGSA
jgi:hypothetical protein